MPQELTFPNSHLEFARILKDNNNCISTTLSFVSQNVQLDFEERKQLEATLLRVKSRVRKAKKPLDYLEGDWWHYSTSMEPELKRNRFYYTVVLSSDYEEVISTLSANHKKSFDNLTMQQQERSRLSNVLESTKALSIVDNTSEIKITTLALQLLSSQTKQREMAKRNSIVLQSDIQMYPNPETPLSAYMPSAICPPRPPYFCRQMSTLPPPRAQDFPLQIQIADRLDGSGCHTVYNQSNTYTDTKSFILFCFRSVKIIGNSSSELLKNNTPNSPFPQRPIFRSL
ncbi:hypothetical protein LOD99_11044 [Oopsacas minuta]|uniref:Uncharacterized protein n=1 Tax=Oopsacas minuta TaxID=111878 RepID=A0AAV7KB52_9METZ|nr:hypothetical protein LOD99_11044 [Oopsacas minuta]